MQPPDNREKHPPSWLLGLDALFNIKHDALTYYESLHYKYGDVTRLRLGPYQCWFLFHPDHIEQVLAKQADKFIRFKKIMNILKQWNGNSLLIAEGASWKNRRRKVMPAFKRDRMPEYAAMISKHAQEFTAAIDNQISAHGKYSCGIDSEMAKYALDIAGITLFGSKLGSGSEIVSKAVHDLSEIAYKETVAPYTLPLFIPTPHNIHKRAVIKTMKGAIREIVTERLHNHSEDRGDLLSILIEHHEGDQTSIEEDTMSLLIAGHETSGATMSWLFLLLAQHQNILDRIHQELDSELGFKAPTYEDVIKLPYLTATIKEVMRLYPAPYALFCRQAIEDVDIGGAVIRAGDLVQLLPYVTQRDERWFKNPLDFNPDRFLKNESWPLYAYFPFGAGPRVCVGQSFGMMEVMITAATILQKYNITSEKVHLEASPRFSLRPKDDYQVAFGNR